MLNLGKVKPGSTIYLPFDSFGANGESLTLTGLAVTDIEVYKDGSMTQRGSDNGYTLLDTDGIDLDGVTGIHGLSIDLADNSTAGFYAAGSRYWVVVSSVTINAQTVSFILGYFEIGIEHAVLSTTIATLSSQTSFTLTAGPAEDDALNGCVVYIHDVASAVQGGFAVVLDYTGSTKTVTLAAGTTFTAAASDNIGFFPPANLSYILGALVSASTAQLGVNVVNFGGAAGTFAGGRPEVNTTHAAGTAWGSGAITAASIASNAFTAAKFASGAFDAVWTVATRTLTAFSTSLAVSVWDVLASAVATASSIGLQIKTNLDATVSTRATQTSVDTIDDFLDTEIATILAAVDTEIAAILAAVDTETTAASIGAAVWGALRADYAGAGTFGQGVASVQGAVTGAVGSVTGSVGGNVVGSVGSLAAQAKADVNAEVNDVLNVDTKAEETGVPAANAPIGQKLNYLFAWRRNRKTQTSTTMTLRNDANDADIATSAVSDDGTTLVIAEDA